jgi:hypothetical protein
MRSVFLALALALGACDGSVGAGGDGAQTAEGYTIEIRATEAEQTYLVTAPDGRTVGARAAEGASALMDATRARALVSERPPTDEDVPEVMALRLPGFELSVGAAEDAEGERGRVALSIDGGAQDIEVNADEGGPGEGDDRAYVRITGADEETVRDFIAKADELSPAVQAQMLAELGLD